MEQKSAFDKFELNLNDQIFGLLKETANWAYFLAIIGFIGIGLMVVFGALFGVILQSMPVNPYENVGVNVSYFGLIYIFIALVYFMPVLYLFNFARKMKAAIQSKNNEVLASSFKNLKSHYKFIGVLTMVIISFYVLAIIIGGLGAFI